MPDDEQWSPAEQAEMAAALAEFKASRARREPEGTLELGKRLDSLKGNWYEWQCTLIKPDGNAVDGTVQADFGGDLIAKETFEES
jgi:hypothetical protein